MQLDKAKCKLPSQVYEHIYYLFEDKFVICDKEYTIIKIVNIEQINTREFIQNFGKALFFYDMYYVFPVTDGKICIVVTLQWIQVWFTFDESTLSFNNPHEYR
ncbi:MAG: hypothetical protein IJ566_07220 [Cardiobacteriaceae bacterium]|nr:hypothetical protein [Cardiobacteriaceae bacterium]